MKDRDGRQFPDPWSMILPSLRGRFILGMVFFVLCVTVPVRASDQEKSTPTNNLESGKQYFRKGDYGSASQVFQDAARRFEHPHQIADQISALLYQAQTLQQMGQYVQARKALITAYQLARPLDSPALSAEILGQIGRVHFLMGKNSLAHHFLCRAITLAGPTTDIQLKAALYNDFGNVLLADQQFSQAIGRYRQSVTMAEATGQEALAVSALINSAQAFLEHHRVKEADDMFRQAYQRTLKLPPTRTKVDGLLNIGLGLERLAEANAQSTERPGGLQALSDQKIEMEDHAASMQKQWVLGEISQEEYLIGRSRYGDFTMAWDRWIAQLDQALQEDQNPECSDDYQTALQNTMYAQGEFLEFLSQNTSRELRGPLGIMLREGIKILTDAAYKLIMTPSTVIAAESSSTEAGSADKKEAEQADRSQLVQALYYESQQTSE